MFDDVDPDEHTSASLRRAYGEALRDAIETAGSEQILDATDLDPAAIDALTDGAEWECTVEESAAILAAAGDRQADALLAAARDRLLLGMSSAVLDVDALGRALEKQPKELQQKIEGRQPMALAEYAEAMAYVTGEQ